MWDWHHQEMLDHGKLKARWSLFYVYNTTWKGHHHFLQLYVQQAILINCTETGQLISCLIVKDDICYSISIWHPDSQVSFVLRLQGYQFWAEADADGYFSINNIRTGFYNLYGWVPGFIGDYKYDEAITITEGVPFLSFSISAILFSCKSNILLTFYYFPFLSKTLSRLWYWLGRYSIRTSKRWSHTVGNRYARSFCCRILCSWPWSHVHQQTLCESSRQVRWPKLFSIDLYRGKSHEWAN